MLRLPTAGVQLAFLTMRTLADRKGEYEGSAGRAGGMNTNGLDDGFRAGVCQAELEYPDLRPFLSCCVIGSLPRHFSFSRGTRIRAQVPIPNVAAIRDLRRPRRAILMVPSQRGDCSPILRLSHRAPRRRSRFTWD